MAEVREKGGLTAVAVAAAISFIISGIGGALLQKYVSRAKPEITVTAAGFEGTSDFIEIPDDLLQTSADDSWGDTLAKYERFDKMRAREEDAGDTEVRLSKLIPLAEAWTKENSSGEGPLRESEILKHPLFADPLFGSSLNGLIRRRELGEPPVSKFESMSIVFPLYATETGPMMHTGKVAVSFPEKDFMDRSMRDPNNTLAMSFSRGERRNVVYYTTRFLESERASLLTLKKLREQLRTVLLEQSRPTLTIVIHNAGDTPVAFRPYFGMNVLAADQRSVADSYLMTLVSDSSSSPNIGREKSSTRAKIEPYLPRVGGLSYTTISPGASQTLRLIATTTMGPKGMQYRTSYESGLLNTRILGLTAEGGDVWSPVSVFGSNVNKESEQDIIQRLK